jgi:hypothetical protein
MTTFFKSNGTILYTRSSMALGQSLLVLRQLIHHPVGTIGAVIKITMNFYSFSI